MLGGGWFPSQQQYQGDVVDLLINDPVAMFSPLALSLLVAVGGSMLWFYFRQCEDCRRRASGDRR